MKTQTIEYKDQDVLLEGFYAQDDKSGGKKPLVIICHDWSGRNEFANKKAQKIAELGYVGFALDMFGKGKLGKTKEEKSALIQPLMGDRKLLLRRVQAGLAAAKSLAMVDTSKIAIMGFCFGGLCALDLARSGADLKAAISFHGLLNAPEGSEREKIKAKVLVMQGYDDPMVKPDEVNIFAQEMTKAKADWQIYWYGNTMHGFTNPEANDPGFGILYDAKADHRSWQALKDFLGEIFK